MGSSMRSMFSGLTVLSICSSPVLYYTLSYKTGENLTEGMPVVVLGFTIGRVSALELSDKGVVIVRIKIPRQHTRMIRDDSKFILEKPLIGVARLEVQTTNLSAPPPPG